MHSLLARGFRHVTCRINRRRGDVLGRAPWSEVGESTQRVRQVVDSASLTARCSEPDTLLEEDSSRVRPLSAISPHIALISGSGLRASAHLAKDPVHVGQAEKMHCRKAVLNGAASFRAYACVM
jgi:hypothetical protein